ncbi:MAG: Rpn family recombination-promoting nuclease/putative transposase [Proteobacteria bacterium]|nr:Rpn family recombination-promoting nuclease/putative transposase [Pseudomonadota bacterium]
MHELLDPKNDIVFKMLFIRDSSRRLLPSLLNAVLDLPSPIIEFEILNPELPKDFIDDKGTLLDIHIKLAGGEHINVEMQMAQRQDFWARLHYYWARVFSQQIKRGQIYHALRPTSVIFFNNFMLDSSSAEDLHLRYGIEEQNGRAPCPEFLRFDLVQLPLIAKHNLKVNSAGKDAILLAWCCFLRNPNDEELEHMAIKNPIINDAIESLQKLSDDAKAREMAWQREKAELDSASARENARLEWLEKGKLEALLTFSRNLQANGINLNQIDAILGITLAELTLLLKSSD